ncbi:ANTAR domain protein [Arthrobacter saudimassiliensis]|uniref:ANTAR domain protein n=1 Tax=Arthrobacter saudimassiliensis TaxID=1461584 RepID=A0A078MMY1_9MICC|nr:ANTAR domain protein [Arthrobacter saudimassiliensis]
MLIDRAPANAPLATTLNELVCGARSLDEMTRGLAHEMARALPQQLTGCTVSLHSGRRLLTCGSDAALRSLEDLQHRVAEGPATDALTAGKAVWVPDLETETRWPEFTAAARNAGIRAVASSPVQLETQQGRACLTLLFAQPLQPEHGPEQLDAAIHQAVGAVRLYARIHTLQAQASDMRSAMASRTAIDLAIGIIMGQNQCTQAEAFHILRTASSRRNEKLRDIAARMVAKINGGEPATHFHA